MFGSALLDPEMLASIAQGMDEQTGAAILSLIVAMTAEVSTLRRAFVSLLGVVEMHYPAARDLVLQDLHEALNKETDSLPGIVPCAERVDALNFLIDVLEMGLRPDQA